MSSERAVYEAAADAFHRWVAEHRDLTIPECVQEGVRAAFAEWLEKNSDQVTAAIAEHFSEGVRGG